LFFNGKSDYVMLPTVQFDGRPPWTLEAIVNTVEIDQAPGGWTSLVSAADGGSISLGTNRHKWAIDVFTLLGESKTWMENYHSAFARERPVNGAWEHVAGVWDGHELRLYINGELQDTRTGVDRCTWLSHGPIFIGADPDSLNADSVAQGYLHGRIRAVRISREAEYAASFTKPEKLEKTPETIGLYDFTVDTGRYAIDQSGHGNHGIIVGAKFVPAE
jgi:hypothetical protein